MKHIKTFNQVNESLNENLVDSYVKKFHDKMDGSTPSTAAGWIDGIGGLSDDDKRSVWMGIQDAIDHESQGPVELPDWVSGSSRGKRPLPDHPESAYQQETRFGKKKPTYWDKRISGHPGK